MSTRVSSYFSQYQHTQLINVASRAFVLHTALVESVSEGTVLATVGELTILPCHPSDNGDVEWIYLNGNGTIGHTKVVVLADYGRTLNEHGKRFALPFTDDGDQSLRILNTTLAEAGVYFCTQRDGQIHKVILRVNGNTTLMWTQRAYTLHSNLGI